ncbi:MULTISPECIES: O-linked N-acetylglucosamine transferase, SPINDLY family protein [Stenotrophomonas]|jgi:predicted O-linked N-acetylglucosamine transferase (SPINDLY family)|uniref:O-linked N-acetylglucosamine transferase, SPINDLY family protein n=1 Tax=Stenotrophomonas TaxID=40323 RepID=UPI000DA852B4|nr:tetratricopeptide repeat protein [Stenotrophomonas sp. PAMC25021]MBH1514293.1 tetratricopeptide repeat protein [Stenotrophomonas maltophilia]MBH1545975.1 tetratricopeptide repeat protein [Stenotrophomonas maltophilia]MBH1833772.1 tetratricopeptide repeat protein [Stenotrophomonas maltophilia]MBH1861753.1 tetratricopeptide repeat protein [Stenotrophomonas maltophilia]MBN5064488.1 tetratricopeptide repeat protein [Stenotrophomonas maltophilia]
MSAWQQRQHLQQAIARQPGDFVAWVMLADLELEAGDIAAGEQAARRALQLRPNHPEALARLGRVAWMAGAHADAAKLLGQASALAPQHPGIALWLGHALEDADDAEGAAAAYRRAHALMPDEPYIAAQRLAWQRRLCDWQDVDTLAAQVRAALAAGHGAVEPFAFLSEDASAGEQLACARARAALIAASVRPLPAVTVRARGPLRVGFLSNGFGAHPTGLLTVALLEHLRHDPALQLHLFALNRADGSGIRERLQSATRLHEVAALRHADIAARIRAQGIDLLFDLRGWGGGGTPEVLAMRPAPLQLNWLAYPGTSGARWLDAVVADEFVLPAALEPHFSERVLRLPRAFQPSDNTRTLEPSPSRAECGLPEHGVVFCCFNNSYKLNPRSMGRAFAVLQAVPGSVLWLLSGPGQADARLRTAAQAAGLDPARLVFMAKLPHPQYLARYPLADLFLDTHPYNAHTTASDALWAGCPVLTCPGDTFAARVAGSLNHHLGLARMNVADDAAFIATASALGNDPAALASLRAELAQARDRSGLFDMAGFARDLSALLQRLAGEHGWQGVDST